MANKTTIPDFPTMPDFGQMITQACEIIASVRGIPYDFNGTLSLENKFVVLFKTVKEMFDSQDSLVKSYKALYDFVNQYFSNLDLQEEVNTKIEEIKNSGELLNLIKPTLTSETTAWLTANITNPSNPPIDKSLTIGNAAADSKVTGYKINSLKEDLNKLNDGGLNLKDEVIAEDIHNWLNEHPEATTTVQDESLDYKKLVKGTLGYVTPEMYGAVGDDITDDSDSLIETFAQNKPVVLSPNKTYAFSKQITIGSLEGNGSTLHSLRTDRSEVGNVGLMLVKSNSHIRNVVFDGGMDNPGQLCHKHVYSNYEDKGYSILREETNAMENVIIENCIFKKSTHMSIQFYNYNGKNVIIKNNYFYRSNRDSIFVYCSNLVIDGNIIVDGEDNYIGIDGEFVDNKPIHDITITNNQFIKNIENQDSSTISISVGIWLHGGETKKNTISNVMISNNLITANWQGIRVGYTKNVQISNNNIKVGGLGSVVSTETYAIEIESSAGCRIISCEMESTIYGCYVSIDSSVYVICCNITCKTPNVVKSFSTARYMYCNINATFNVDTIDNSGAVLMFCNIIGKSVTTKKNCIYCVYNYQQQFIE